MKHQVDKDGNGVLDVDETQALTHYDESLNQWQEEHQYGDTDENTTIDTNGSDNGHGYRGGDDNNMSGDGEGYRYGQDDNHTEGENNDTFDINTLPATPTLTQDLKDAIAYMGNEERLAYDVYMNLYNYHSAENDTDISILQRIATNSEVKHVGIVQDMVAKYNLSATDTTNVESAVATPTVTFEAMPSGQYGIPAIQALYNALYEKGVTSQEEALMVGCMVEVTDITDLDEKIELAEQSNAEDIEEGFEKLRSASYNHYWSFDSALKDLGVTNGCYVEGDTLLTDKTGIYPTKDEE